MRHAIGKVLHKGLINGLQDREPRRNPPQTPNRLTNCTLDIDFFVCMRALSSAEEEWLLLL